MNGKLRDPRKLKPREVEIEIKILDSDRDPQKMDMDTFLTQSPTWILEASNQEKLIEILSGLTQQSLETEFRSTFPTQIFQKLNEILKISIQNLDSDSQTKAKEISIGILRLFRNLCVNSESNQIVLYDELMFGTIRFLMEFMNSRKTDSDNDAEIKRFCLQLIGNSIVGNRLTCMKLVDEELDGFGFMLNVLSHETDTKVLNYCGMIGLTITQQLNSSSSDQHLLLQHLSSELMEVLLNSLEHEFVILWFEALCTLDQFLPEIYPNLQSSSTKVKFLHGILDHKPCHENLSIPSIEFFTTNFKSLADQILVTNASLVPEELNPLEVTLSVELFCKLIQFKQKFEGLKEDGSFATSVIYLLRTIHNLGTIPSESGEPNCFTPIETLGTPNDEIPSKPWFLFKANLIRLIGGFVENHPNNQNRVRELECLEVILNCTKIDSRNPFIPQCSIMTLKFLLENNTENQEYVKRLEKIGDCKLRV